MRPLRILASFHHYLPRHSCGAEHMAHTINKYLVKQGHHVRVIIHQAYQYNISQPYFYEGVEVMPPPTRIQEAFLWADIVITHLDYTQFTVEMCDKNNRPCIHLKHNDTHYKSIEVAKKGNHGVIFNSKWMAEAEKGRYPHPSMIMYPPVDVDQYNVCPNPAGNKFVTLINLNEDKGGKIFSRIAAAMPEKQFLGVKGYHKQFYRQLPNLTILDNTPDILPVYAQTRILLMLSRYESWGRTATEAMCNGIPVICTPTKGLMENCGGAALYVNERHDLIEFDGVDPLDDAETYDISKVIAQIRKLDRPNFYEACSDRARERAEQLRPDKQLKEFEQFMFNML